VQQLLFMIERYFFHDEEEDSEKMIWWSNFMQLYTKPIMSEQSRQHHINLTFIFS